MTEIHEHTRRSIAERRQDFERRYEELTEDMLRQLAYQYSLTAAQVQEVWDASGDSVRVGELSAQHIGRTVRLVAVQVLDFPCAHHEFPEAEHTGVLQKVEHYRDGFTVLTLQSTVRVLAKQTTEVEFLD